MKITTKAIYEWDKDAGQYVEVYTESYKYFGPIDKLFIHDEIGEWWNRNIRNPIAEGYFGYHKGPDWVAEATLEMGSEMREDLGATSPGEINDIIASYEAGGDLPEGRLGDILRLSEEYMGAIGGEYDVKGEMADVDIALAGYGVDTAKEQRSLLAGKETQIEDWLEGNLFGIERGKEAQYQKTGGITGPTRGGARARKTIASQAEQKFGAFETEMNIADIGVDVAEGGVTKAGLGKDLLEYDESKSLIKAESDRLASINQIKDLIYELETQELQFG